MLRTLIKKLSIQLPFVYKEDQCFYYLAEIMLAEYEASLKTIEPGVLSDFLKATKEMKCEPTAQRFINLIHSINRTCLEILQYAYKGQMLESAKLLDKLMSVPKYTDYKLMDWYFNYMTLEPKNLGPLFRCVDFRKDENPKDCNHVPFQLRRFASKGRYNVLGFPCLYLSSSLPCASKEVGELAKDKVRWYGEFKQNKQLFFMDFTLPSDKAIDKMSDYDMFCFLVTYPLRTLCNFKMKDSNSPFNEEYLFSQLFLHIMFLNKKDIYPNYTGIEYTSMHDRSCVNYVIPAIYDSTAPPLEGHSKYILDCFEQVGHQKMPI